MSPSVAAATRMQTPVVAHDLLLATRDTARGSARGKARHNGDGACPLTVEHGRIVLAEFICGGTLAPSFPTWLDDGTRSSRLACYLGERILPPRYWRGMLEGHEWLAQPETVGR